MDCTHFQELINTYLDGDLGQQVKVELETHMHDCANCTAEISDWEMCRRTLCETFPDQPPPGELWEKIQAMLATK